MTSTISDSKQPEKSATNWIRVNFVKTRRCGIFRLPITYNDNFNRHYDKDLNKYLSSTEWTDFCNEVDSVITRHNLTENNLALSAVHLANFIASIIFTPFLLTLVIPAVIYAFYQLRVSSSAQKSIRTVCEDFSSKHPNLTFHFRDRGIHTGNRCIGRWGTLFLSVTFIDIESQSPA